MEIDIKGLRYGKQNDLKSAIKTRVEERLKNGAVDEARQLIEEGFNKSDPGLQTIGYKIILQLLSGKNSEKIMKEQ